MDPNANLAEQRRIVKRVAACSCPGGPICGTCEMGFQRLADLAEALDDWITRGGALPDIWRHAVAAALVATVNGEPS